MIMLARVSYTLLRLHFGRIPYPLLIMPPQVGLLLWWNRRLLFLNINSYYNAVNSKTLYIIVSPPTPYVQASETTALRAWRGSPEAPEIFIFLFYFSCFWSVDCHQTNPGVVQPWAVRVSGRSQ